jgi:DNA polymerase I-like protein with 3'-5' exonuclease and polymerase domains
MGISAAFGTFGTPSASVFGKTHALLWERRDERPGATLELVCHDEIVVECDAERAADAKAWLERAMIEGMNAVMNGMDEVDVPVEVEARRARSWGEGG